MTEASWDKLLQIKTDGRDDKNADEYRYPYEPTPYSVLDRLAESELFGEGIVIALLRVDLVDSGGKKYRADGNSNEHYANGKFYRYAAAAL